MTDLPDVLRGRNIVLGVSGGIAAYKTPFLVRLLRKAGADVQVVMTRDAGHFVTATTLGTVSEREVFTGIFPDQGAAAPDSWTRHVHLGLWADLVVIAPATANTIARLAHGLCDNMLAAVVLSARCPVLVCPAMDHDMYRHPATRANLETLVSLGHSVMPAEHGELASGLVGEGRMPEPDAIVARIAATLRESLDTAGDLSGRTVLVTAGPTREAIDPVRFVSNYSSGKMGYAIAAEAAQRGARVTLISGPTSLTAPANVRLVNVTSAAEMLDAVQREATADVVVMAAAVSDYRPAAAATHKLKKSDDDTTIALTRTADILAGLGAKKRPGQVLVGFALETRDELEYARAKMASKNLDLIVVNNPTREGSSFGGDSNEVSFLGPHGDVERLPVLSKRRVASLLLDRVCALLKSA